MDRKMFLGTLIALPVGLFLVSCSSSNNSGSSGSAPAAPPSKSGTLTTYTSSNDGSPTHSHTFSIDDSSFTTPPSAGISGDTSNSAGHTHSVSISMAGLQQVGMGESVMVTTSNVSAHTHDFTFVKVA